MTLENSDTTTAATNTSHHARYTRCLHQTSAASTAATFLRATGFVCSPLPPLPSTPTSLDSSPSSSPSSLSPATPLASSACTATSADHPPLQTWHRPQLGQKCLATAQAVGLSAVGGTAAAAEAGCRPDRGPGASSHAGTASLAALNDLHRHSSAHNPQDARPLHRRTPDDDLAGSKRPPDDQLLRDPSLSAAAALSQLLLMPSPPKRPRLLSTATSSSFLGSGRLHRAVKQRTTPNRPESRHSHPAPTLEPSSGPDLHSDPESNPGFSSPNSPPKTSHKPVFAAPPEPIPAMLSADSPGTSESATSWQAATSASLRTSPPPSPLVPLRDIGLAELLDQDDRPTFIVDLANVANFRPGPLHLLFANAALRAERPVFGLLSRGKGSSPPWTTDFARFRDWVLTFDGDKAHDQSMTHPPSSFPAPYTFADLRWTYSTLRRRYRVVRGNHNAHSAKAAVPDQRQRPTATLPWLPGRATDTALPSPVAEVGSRNQIYSALGGTDDYFGNVNSATALATHTKDGDESIAAARPLEIKPSFDWTQISITDDLPPHIRFARSIDWSATPLGPIELWPADLRTMVNLVMGSPQPAAMYWGAEFTAIYNEAYVSVAGRKHPQLMGSSYPVIWAGEVWDAMKPAFHDAWHSGKAILKYDDRLFMDRHGSLEETYFNWSIMPLVGADGSVVALYHSAFEITRRKVNERRLVTLNEIGEKTTKAQTIQGFWKSVCAGLDINKYDVPFALVYSVPDNSNDSESGALSRHSSHAAATPMRIVLEGALGVPPGHPAARETLDINTSDEGFAPYMRQSIAAEDAGSPRTVANMTPIVLSAEDGSLPTGLLVGLQGERGFGDACHTVVVFPIYHPTASVAGFIVMGTNPRRPYSRNYQLFVHLLARQLTTSLASVVLLEEESRQAQQAARRAARDRQELSLQLQLRTQQALESENKFMRMAEFTPVGMFMADAGGQITYCNDMWWAISRHPRAKSSGQAASVLVHSNAENSEAWNTWMESVDEEDRPGVITLWDQLVQEKVPVTHEFRFRRKTILPIDGSTDENTEITTWVLFRAFPEKDERTGELKSIFGCITDISQQKLAEAVEGQRHQEAVEHKRQQENFIDITSHEMRNPMSAILQSVDEICTSIERFRACGGELKSHEDPGALNRLFDSVLEASDTISLCTNHQKHIVDDILTLSKLDSRLLRVSPANVTPVSIVRNTLRMFEADLNAHGICCTLRVQASYQTLIGMDSEVMLDPSRLSQILINLMTNAVNFTQDSEQRNIVISLGASKKSEPAADADVAEYGPAGCKLTYIPSLDRRQRARKLTDGADWGTGTKVRLHMAVSDTGKGLQEDERAMLFQRSQASPRTHVQYGGSGLGLFISRYLAELQGGQIGVMSRLNEGTTFAFYIKCRLTDSGLPLTEATASEPALPPSIVTDSVSAITYSVGNGNGNCNSNGNGNSSGDAHSSSLKSMARRITSSRDTSPASRPSTPGLSRSTPAAPLATWLPSAIRPNGQPVLDVLVVEDNLVNQRVLQRQLNMSGNRAQVANHGEQALEALRQSRFWRDNAVARQDSDCPVAGTNISVILMDLEMPVMDGKTCARAIRRMEEDGLLVRHVPIIAVTAYARTEQIESAKEAGIDDVISKPFRLAQLMPKIQELVARYQTA